MSVASKFSSLSILPILQSLRPKAKEYYKINKKFEVPLRPRHEPLPPVTTLPSLPYAFRKAVLHSHAFFRNLISLEKRHPSTMQGTRAMSTALQHPARAEVTRRQLCTIPQHLQTRTMTNTWLAIMQFNSHQDYEKSSVSAFKRSAL